MVVALTSRGSPQLSALPASLASPRKTCGGRPIFLRAAQNLRVLVG